MKKTWLVTLSMLLMLLVATAGVSIADDEKKSDAAATQSDTEEKHEEGSEEKKEAKEEDKAKSDDKKSDEKKAAEKKAERKTHKVETAEIQADFTTAGIFVARNMTEVELKPEAWGTWKVEHVVPHGTHVKQGEVLVRFESKDLKEAIEELDLELRLNELSIIKAEAELPQVEKHIQISFENAERALEDARREYKDYTEGDRERLVKQIDLRLKQSRQQAENVREELRQLEKMYRDDDLTEETEEIVLKRQRVAAEMADFMLELAKISHERTIDRALPRNDLEQQQALERVEMAYERAKTSLQTDVNRARYELEKAKRARAKALKKHADLTKDLNLLTIKAPADGVVYYGNCTDGNWSNTAALIGKLKKEATAPANSILMTIVELRPMYVVSSVGEAQRPSVEKGQQAIITPTGDEKQEIKAKVSNVSTIPIGPGKFALELELEGEDQPEWLVPGMTGKAKVVTYLNKNALVVPKGAIREDKEKGEKFVWLVDGDKVSKKEVKVGKAKDDKVEITEGLKEGDVVSLDDEQNKQDEAKAAKKKAAKEAEEKKESKEDEKSKKDDDRKDDDKKDDDKKDD